MIPASLPSITSPEIEAAKAACIHALPDIERTAPGDGGTLKVPYAGSYVRVTCFHKDGELIVRVFRSRVVRHYHIIDEARP